MSEAPGPQGIVSFAELNRRRVKMPDLGALPPEESSSVEALLGWLRGRMRAGYSPKRWRRFCNEAQVELAARLLVQSRKMQGKDFRDVVKLMERLLISTPTGAKREG